MTRPGKRAEPAQNAAGPETLGVAADTARKLGHLVLRQGRTFECSRCAASGLVGPDGKQLGAVFTARCEP